MAGHANTTETGCGPVGRAHGRSHVQLCVHRDGRHTLRRPMGTIPLLPRSHN